MAFKKVLIATICSIGLISTTAYAKMPKAEVTVTVPSGSQINIVVKEGSTTTQKATSEDTRKEVSGNAKKETSASTKKEASEKARKEKGYQKTFCLKPGETLHSHLGSHSLSHEVVQYLDFDDTSRVHPGQYTVHNENGKTSYVSSCK